MKSREYLFIRRSRVDYDRNFIVLVSKSVPFKHIPETDEHVRVYDYMSQMVIRPHQNNFFESGFDYMLTYFDDPRASFPSPAYNWMASRGVPDFVDKLHQAALRLSLSKLKDNSVHSIEKFEDSMNFEMTCEENNCLKMKTEKEQLLNKNETNNFQPDSSNS